MDDDDPGQKSLLAHLRSGDSSRHRQENPGGTSSGFSEDVKKIQQSLRTIWKRVMQFGLSAQTIEKINSVFARHPEVEKVVLYGSRAKGTYKLGSDIDLTLYGNEISLT